MHMFAAFYFVIILSIEKEWHIAYDDLIKLWSLGALLIGLGAIPFGWLSDKWSRSSVMSIMFIGMGFNGPATGKKYEEFKKKFQKLISELIDEV